MDKNLRIQIIMGAVDRVTGPLKNVLKGTRGLSTGLKETQDRLKALKAAQADVGRFRELKSGLSATSAELDQARTKAAGLAAQYNATANPTRKLTAEFRRSREAVNALEKKHQDQARELQQVRAKMNEAGAAGRSLAAHERDLRSAVARTNTELQERKEKLSAVAEQQRRMARAKAGYERSQQLAGNIGGAGAGAVGAGAALLAPLALANRAAGDYESTLTDVAQKADLNRTQAAALGVELTRVAVAANQLPPEVVAATDALTGLGAELGDARQMIPDIARAATAYKASMEDLGRASYATVDNLGVAANQTGKVLDIMAEAGKRGAFEIADMAQYFPSLTAASAGLKHTGVPAVADLAAALQITRKGAGDSAEAATNLGNLLQKISSPLTVKNFRKFGVDLEAELKAAAARGESPIEAITKLTDKALGGDLSRLGYLFEDAQVQKALRPLIQNLDEYRSIRAGAMGAKNVVDADFAERLKDQNEAAKAAGVSIRALGLTVGAQLAPTITAAAKLVSGIAKGVTGWAQANPALAGTLAKIVGVVGILLIAFGGIALAVAAVLGPFALAQLAWTAALPVLGLLGPALGVVGKAALFAGRALLMNPIGLAVTAIAIAAFLVIKYWKPIKAFFAGVWSAITGATSKAVEWFKSLPAFFSGVWSAITGAASKAVEWLRGMAPQLAAFALAATGPVGLIIRYWKPITGFFRGVWSGVQAAGGRVLDWLRGLGPQFGAFALAATGPVGLIIRHWSSIAGFFGGLWSRVRAATSAAVAWFAGLGARFREFGANIIAGLVAGIVGRLGQLRSTITGVAGRAAEWFKSKLGIHSPSRVFAGFGGDTMDGLQLGLQRGQDGPLQAIRDVATRLAEAGGQGVQEAKRAQLAQLGTMAAGIASAISVGSAAPAFAAGGSAAAPARPAAPAPAPPPPAVFNIYQLPGQDGVALARAIAAELDRREREKAARGRSVLADTTET